jgi:hypothetical protein
MEGTRQEEVEGSKSTLWTQGKAFHMPPELAAIFMRLSSREERFRMLVGRLPYKAITVCWTTGETHTNFDKIYIRERSESSSESKEDYWERALWVELGNAASAELLVGTQLNLLFSAISGIEEEKQTGKISEETLRRLAQQQPAVAVVTELGEMANALESYLGNGTSYAEFFGGRSSVDALAWLELMIKTGHTTNYDPGASSPSWYGRKILGAYRQELSAISVSQEGAEALRRLAQAIRKEYQL